MKHVLHLSASDLYGGAARASYRIYRSLVKHGATQGVDVSLRVNGAIGNDPSVQSGPPKGVPSEWLRLRLFLNRIYRARFRPGNPTLHSTAWLPSGFYSESNLIESNFNLIHLHWLGDWMLSIEELGALSLPLVWTMHDQWAFLGAEHYTNFTAPDEPSININRYIVGYHSQSRPSFESGPDVNRRTWLRKRRAWKHPINIVCPSSWMAACARRSSLMADWPISVIPYPIDLHDWAPVDQLHARNLLNLPPDLPLVLFGATGGAADFRKGADLLFDALRILATRIQNTTLASLQLVLFGQDEPPSPPQIGIPIRYMGAISDELRLRLLYASSDVFVIPSRQDNLPNTALEAHACGVPIIAFRATGLPDIVEDHVTGLLAEPFDPISLSFCIEKILINRAECKRMGFAARQRAELLWSPARVAGMYADLYSNILSSTPRFETTHRMP